MSGTAGNNNETTILNGHAFVKTKNFEISADKITLTGNDFRMIKAEGNVSANDQKSKIEFSCGKLTFDRETEIADLRTNVKLSDKENEVSAGAQMLEYRQKTETLILQIDIELKQKNNICTGAYAIYHKTEQLLELSGSPKIVQDSDTFKAQEITLDLNSQEITMSGRVQGSVKSSGKKNSENGKENLPEKKPEEEIDGDDRTRT